MLRANMPEQIRAGEEFSFTVNVTNSSDQVTVHDIKLRQRKTSGLTIESVSMQSGPANQDKRQQQAAAEQQDAGEQGMAIDTLKPGENRTFEIKATADQEGELRSCLEICSYTPAMCLTSQVVKPQLELTKSAPKEANRCDVIELEYVVKNGGSGDVGPFQITDSLGEGLATIEGDRKLSFDVDGLEAGETRKFVARLYAEKPGEFTSRAVANADNSELKSRSKPTTTKVIAADLVARVDGPNRIYGDQLARFTGHVTNSGNAPAEDIELKVSWPTAANLMDMSEVSVANSEKSQGGNNAGGNNAGGNNAGGDQGQATTEKSQNSSGGQKSSEQRNERQQQQPEMNQEMLVIDRLEPGQTATFDYAVKANNTDELPTRIEATYVCTVGAAEAQDKASARASAMAMATAKIVRLPAIQLMVIDDEDPVTQGSQVVYTIRVWNEGDAPDNDVELIANLPDALKFVSAEGPTKNSQDGSTVTFEPIKTMKPGDRVDYKITAKGQNQGNVRFQAKLTSKKFPAEVTAEEPTRVFVR